MRMTGRIFQIAVVLFSIATAVSAQSDWIGKYTFDENGGKNAGGTAILISHELSVFDDGEGGLAARLESNGFQTSVDVVCMAKVVGTKLQIYFQSYGEDNMFEPYKAGDLLFTLERRSDKIILTHWGKFTASIPKNEKSGKVYFEKTEQK